MPFRRRPVRPLRPPAPVNHSPASPLAPTVLPTSFIPVTGPPKLPPRPFRGDHPLGTLLTVPTVGPLPPLSETIVPAVVPPPRRPALAVPPRRPNVGAPFIPGMPLARAPPGRVPVLRR
jgi:hypothetical protein